METIFGLGPNAPKRRSSPPPVSTATGLSRNVTELPVTDMGDVGQANKADTVVGAVGGVVAGPELPELESVSRVGFPALGPARNPGALAPLAALAQSTSSARPALYSRAVRGPAPGRRVKAPLETGLEEHTPGRRNVVRLRWDHALLPIPTKRQFVRYLFDLGFKPVDLFAILAPGDPPQYYDVSFLSQQGMESFLEERLKESENNEWHSFKVIPLSRQTLERKAHVVVHNESIPVRDLMTWVQHYADIMSPPHRVLDELGIWWGEYEVAIRLRVKEGAVTHIPRSALIGRDKVITYYPGQPRTCNRCGKRGHLASNYPDPRCSRCQEFGHSAPSCRRIKCNFCFEFGHPYTECPISWATMPSDLKVAMLANMGESQEVSVPDPSVSVKSVPVLNVSTSSVNPSSVVPSPGSLSADMASGRQSGSEPLAPARDAVQGGEEEEMVVESSAPVEEAL
ncbi:zinc finger CCHC domain-containing protein 3-like [Hyperolius riggenbachi]|uniref:zinc finger CCHC domain-containing protein 3-like n=1 Tax=Hyperolius riggenbachi TaxID=752182 RepID=UPI0035A3B557